jgi:aryl-alcohol dehydrogenase-like predicted oxidoreductase
MGNTCPAFSLRSLICHLSQFLVLALLRGFASDPALRGIIHYKKDTEQERIISMFTRQLGQTDLAVSALCFGGNVFGWTLDEQGSFSVLDAYLDGGGNFIDTADVYGQGASESILGRWMRSRKNRVRIILATKMGSQMGNDPMARGLSRRYILQAVEASLKRLQTDAIDLYQAHRDDPDTPLAETMAAFDELVRA